MIDFHTHILPGIDDGSRNGEMTREMLEEERRQGVTLIAATPHFYASRMSVDGFLARRAAALERTEGLRAESPEPLPGLVVGAEVLYFPTYGETGSLPENVKVIPEKVAALERTEVGMLLRTGAGEYPVHAVFVLREAVAPGQLVPGLETEGPHVRVNRSMESSLPGLFACGDIVGPPYQYIKAAGEGNIAALSAVSYLSAAR